MTVRQGTRSSLCTLLLWLLAWIVGCRPAPDPLPPAASEMENTSPTLSFADQVRAVRSGATDEIHWTGAPLGDDDLARLATLSELRLLDAKLDVTADGLRHLAALRGLEHIVLRGGQLDDEALQVLATCRSLKIINLPQANFGDDGLAHLPKLADLELLRFRSPHVTDEGMRHLVQLKSLRFLHVIGAPLTDRGLEPLAAMQQLESFYIDDSQVTDDGIERLLAALPELHVHINQQHTDRDPHRHPHAPVD